jgi:multidrug efflux pump subunit AcrA (membrane-fusion protein)
VVKIPSEAIVERDGKQFVFVAGADEKAVRKNVKIGINIDGKAEITEGLAAGDKVVIRGQTLLEDGARIKVIEQLPALPAQDTVL